jgi:hypothetical protein
MIKAIDIAARATKDVSPPANLPGISSFDDEALLKESIHIAGMIPFVKAHFNLLYTS